jgi:hypothetical protein
MQAVSDCPQFGGVISRTVVLSRRSAWTPPQIIPPQHRKVRTIEQRPSKAKSGSHDDLVGGFFNGIDPTRKWRVQRSRQRVEILELAIA